MSDYLKIKCPKCGYEYTLAEIIDGQELLGSPSNIIRDSLNKIIFIEGDEPIDEIEWQCDKCGEKFKIKVNISANIISENDADKTYNIDLFKQTNLF